MTRFSRASTDTPPQARPKSVVAPAPGARVKHVSSRALSLTFALFCACVLLTLCQGLARAAETAKPLDSKVLELIRARGAINVGIKTDFPPFGALDASGKPEGFEIDLANDIGKRLGVKTNLVVVSTDNRFQKLEQGAVDVLIATIGDTAARRQVATAIEPNYMSSGVTIMTKPDKRIETWSAIRGQKLCATQGSYFNRPMQERYLLDLQLYRSTRDALLALSEDKCVAYLYSSAAIEGFLRKPEWADYKIPLPVGLVVQWAMMIAMSERGTELEILLGDISADWHRSGFLIATEKKWGLIPTDYLASTQKLWLQTEANGDLVCHRGSDHQWTARCRNASFVTAKDESGFRQLGLKLRELSGINLSVVFDEYDRYRFLVGIAYTLGLAIMAMIGTLLVGYFGAKAAQSHSQIVSRIAKGIATYGRMTPPLLQMYMLFFGFGALLVSLIGFSLPAFIVALLCLCLNSGAAAMFAVLDASAVLQRQNPRHTLSLETFPKVALLAQAPLKGVLINVVKQTMIASAIAVPELLAMTTAILADQGNILVMMNILLLSFLLLITLVSSLIDRVFNRLRQSRSAS